MGNASSRTRSATKPQVVLVEGRDYHRLIQGMQAEAFPLNWQLMACDVSWENLPQEFAPVGAIVWRGSEIATYLEQFDFPLVRFCYRPNDNTPRRDPGHLAYDDIAAGRLAATHFLERGFSNIAFIRSQRGWRQNEFEKEFTKTVRATDSHYFCLDPFEQEEKEQVAIIKTMIDWVQDLPKPVGIQTFNDEQAVQLLHACISANLQVPEDVAVMGRTNHPFFCELAPIPLSSIDPDGMTMGREAVRLLKRLLDGESEPQAIIKIPPKIILRRSTDTLAVADSRVATALRFMYDYLSSPITIEDVAAEVGCSKRTIERAFSKTLGRGINAELRRKRLERACTLLQNTDMTVAQIAHNIGLGTPEYLHRMFKNAFNITPQAYRQTHMTQ